MNTLPMSAARKGRTLNSSSVAASEVPTSTGAIAAGSVRGREASSQSLSVPRGAAARPVSPLTAADRRGPSPRSRPLRELAEVRPALRLVRLAALARLLAGVEEKVGVVRELLEAGHAVLGGVEARLQEPQGKRGELQHLAAPRDGLFLEALERHDRVHEPHLQRLLGPVLAAQEPDLLRLLLPDLGGEQAGAVAAVEAPHLRAGLAEAGVVGGDREVADHVQHVPAADRVAGDHGDDRLGRAPHLHVQVGHVKAPDLGAAGHVAGVAAHALVAAGAERERAVAGEDDHADLGVLARALERLGHLDQGLGPEGIADLGAVDGDLGDPVRQLVADVLVITAPGPPVGTGSDVALRSAHSRRNDSPQPLLEIHRLTMYRDAWYGPPAGQLLRARVTPRRTPARVRDRSTRRGALGGRGPAHGRHPLRGAGADGRAGARPGRPRGDRGGQAAALLPADRRGTRGRNRRGRSAGRGSAGGAAAAPVDRAGDGVKRRLTDAVTSLAAQTFPPSRRADGRVVRDCARDAIDAAGLRAMVRETASVAFAGLRVRWGVSVRDVRQAPWRPALGVLTLPLAAALLCVWTFGFVPRYDHWPLGEGWVLLLGGSLVAVIGAAFAARWVIVLGAAAVFVAAGAPYVGYGTETALSDTPSFFPASGVDLGAAS